MSHDLDARRFFVRYGLGSISRIADRDQSLYRAFGLKRGNIIQLFGPGNWVRGLSAIFSGNIQELPCETLKVSATQCRGRL